MAIYTKTGDDGMTSTFGGCRVNKDTPLMEAIGTVDELNSVLGIAVSLDEIKGDSSHFVRTINDIQKDLFGVGAMLAGDNKNLQFTIYNLQKRTNYFEKKIDETWRKLPPIKNFIIPGGTNLAATLFLARAICRRTERRVVSLKKYPDLVKYLNRLSDYLFVMARYVNLLEKEKETIWKGNFSY